MNVLHVVQHVECREISGNIELNCMVINSHTKSLTTTDTLKKSYKNLLSLLYLLMTLFAACRIHELLQCIRFRHEMPEYDPFCFLWNLFRKVQSVSHHHLKISLQSEWSKTETERLMILNTMPVCASCKWYIYIYVCVCVWFFSLVK